VPLLAGGGATEEACAVAGCDTRAGSALAGAARAVAVWGASEALLAPRPGMACGCGTVPAVAACLSLLFFFLFRFFLCLTGAPESTSALIVAASCSADASSCRRRAHSARAVSRSAVMRSKFGAAAAKLVVADASRAESRSRRAEQVAI
jgi:hypothetical protein